MITANVIARAAGGKPINAVVVSHTDRVFYISAVTRIEAVRNGQIEPIGFPKEDVFLFNTMAYELLSAEWQEKGATSKSSWRQLSRYSA
jgi:hypothetical protein